MGAAPILTILKNGEKLKEQALEGEALIGRGEGCVIRLEDRAISRNHAVLRPVPGGVQIEKKSEFAPISVNGAECTSTIVKEGDVINIGPYLMKVSIPAEAREPSLQAQEGLLPPLDAGPAPDATAAPLPESALDQPLSPDGPDDALLAPLDASPSGGELALDAAPAGGDEGGLDLDAAGGEALPDVGGAPALDLGGDPGLQIPEEPSEDPAMVDEDGATRLTPAAKLAVKLIFPPGSANVTEFDLTQDEISIGRGKNCDIVLNDKKSSRKHAIIRRAGLNFMIKDLDSANGILVNGVRVKEQELAGDDVIVIGDVEFLFKAMSADYEARKGDFMQVPEEPDPGSMLLPGPIPSIEGLDGQGLPDPMAPDPNALAAPGGMMAPAIILNTPGLVGTPGLAGLPSPDDYKKMSFFDKLRNFKNLPPRQKAIVGFIALGLAFFIFIDEDAPEAPRVAQKKPGVTAPTANKGPATFESLTPEQQRFVETQHSLAFDHYRNKDYDKALYEIRKIFTLIGDYKDSKEIERYALEGKRKLEAIEEEKRKKEEEARLKAKIEELVGEAKDKMAKKQYEQAREIFGQILAIDPDNIAVANWQKEIQEHEENLKLKEQEKQVQAEINKRAYEMLAEAMAIKKTGRYHSAIAEFAKIPDIGASDPRPARRAKAQIRICRKLIAAKRDPLLAEAKAAEEAGEFAKAYKLYQKATKVDPPHKAGYAGMNRIRAILHEKCKLLYTEAVLAESYSDFATAQRKYREVLDAAPEDDIYHDRAQRKLAKYFKREEASQPQ